MQKARGTVSKSKDSKQKEVAYPLSERAQMLLKTLIERYILDGQPVGSKLLAQHSGLDLSSASIRNVLADLENKGLIASPHTSAGRVPTDLGYRIFVDSLVSVKPLDESTVNTLRGQLTVDATPANIISKASDLLSEVSKMTSLVFVPNRDKQTVRQIEFLPLSDSRVLAILVMENGEVENRIVRTGRAFSESQLGQSANFLNQHFVGRTLEEIRRDLLSALEQSRQEVNDFMTSIVHLADTLFTPSPQESLVVSGQANLMNFDETAHTDKLKKLFDSFSRKKEILELFDSTLLGQGIKIFIGNESGSHTFDECALISAPYKVDERTIGVLGIVGPRRMAYQNVIPLVDITAKLLSAALQNK